MKVNCPTCESKHKSEKGMKIHHSRSHNRSLPKITKCSRCEIHIRYEGSYERSYCQDCRYIAQGEKMSGENNPLYKDGEMRVCKWCGDDFRNLPHRDRIFCDDDCYKDWQSVNRRGEDHPRWVEYKDVQCHTCGKTKTIPPSVYDKFERHFCNDKCQGQWLSTINGPEHWQWESKKVECDYCNDDLWRQPHVMEKNVYHFCNDECKGGWRSENIIGENHPNWEGGPVYYGSNWHDMRRETLARDEVCQVCDADEELHVHHRTPIRQFEVPEKANTLDNLVVLCNSCHMGVHQPKLVTVEKFAKENPNGVNNQ